MEKLVSLTISILKFLGIAAGAFFLVFSITFLAILLWEEVKNVLCGARPHNYRL
jgi:hypothetical protein